MHQLESVRRPVIQPKLKIGHPGDKFEQEADAMADHVTHMPHNSISQIRQNVNTPQISKMCAHCEEEDQLQMQPLEEEEEIQMKPAVQMSFDGTSSAAADLSQRLQNTKGRGQYLPGQVGEEMGSKIGADFSNVKAHTDSNAIEMNQELGAQAFTHGSDIYFKSGEYNPGTKGGKHLLAHELTHVVQQNGSKHSAIKSPATSASPQIQRRLVVDDTVPADPNEPASGLSQSAFRARVFPQANALVQGLCDQFEVDQGNGEVQSTSGNVCDDLDDVANSPTNPLGCCCLCIMTDPNVNAWTLTISEFEGPHTDPGARDVVVHPFGSMFDFGNWAVPDAATGNERLVGIDPVTILGHELCGHAALDELGAHAANADRVRSNVHDSTVRVQNEIGHEQGVAVNDDRAEAAQGTHRGESTANVTLVNFPFNATSISQLPIGQQNALRIVANFALANDMWIDILGHSDTVGSPSAKQQVSQNRADAVQRFLIGRGLTRIFDRRGLTGIDRYTRVEGRSDNDLLPGAVIGAPDPNLRRVDIIMTTRPAGAQNPVTGTPTTITNVLPDNPANVANLKQSGNACEQLLVGIAWP